MIPTELSQIIAGFILALAGWLARHFFGSKAPTPQPSSAANVLQQLQRDATVEHELKLVQEALQARRKQPQ